jgi:hypothetical protein
MIASYGGIWFSEGRDRDQASMFDAEPLLPMPEVELADLVMPRSGSVLTLLWLPPVMQEVFVHRNV